MKKNFMMRAASVLLVAVMLTTCAISGTFAKYTTAGNSADTARVAKFGVVVTGSADMFETEYAKHDNSFTLATESVVSSGAINGRNKVMAPGTSGVLTDITLAGKPEVAVRVTYDPQVTVSGWTAGTAGYYCPIVITIDSTVLCGLDYTSEADFADAIAAAIDAYDMDYAANTDLSTVGADAPSISWAWSFTNDTHDGGAHNHVGTSVQDDVLDTILGNQAANATPAIIEISIDCTVTQID